MSASVPQTAPDALGTFIRLSLAEAGETLNEPWVFTKWLALQIQSAPGSPVLTLPTNDRLPQLRPPAADAVDLENAFAWSMSEETPPQPKRGKPPISALHTLPYAIQIAVSWDIDREPLIADGPKRRGLHWELSLDVARLQAEREPDGWRTYEGESPFQIRDCDQLALTDADAAGPARSKPVERWRNAGRAELARQGAWPWAVVPDGRLSRPRWQTWWREDQYATALENWIASG